jgi:hypothetical protein
VLEAARYRNNGMASWKGEAGRREREREREKEEQVGGHRERERERTIEKCRMPGAIVYGQWRDARSPGQWAPAA